jgi:hypothetical protein
LAETAFIGGLQLSRLFYEQAVWPILASTFPSLTHSAALIGPGSEVLGYDTPLSTDHDWGPRLFLFLAESDYEAYAPRLRALLGERLPRSFLGYSTHFDSSDDDGSPTAHRVEVQTTRGYATALLGFDPGGELSPTDWLNAPQQTLLELTAGAVFHDGLGELTLLRARLSYYPRNLWLYQMAAQWRRVAQQEAFVGRAGDVGDELGSTLIAASLVRDLMRLCFYIERRYAPYSKWFGTAFARLGCGPAFGPLLREVLLAEQWHQREAQLARAYAAVVTLHNRLGVTPPAATAVSPFHTRPYQVIHADDIAAALLEAIADPAVRALPICGAIDQWSDSTDMLDYPGVRGKLRPLYG